MVRELPGVGANLQDHLQIRSVYKVRGVPTLNTWPAPWWGKATIGLQYLLSRSGPMSMAPHSWVPSRAPAPASPTPTLNTTCSRCRSTPLASRCTASGLHRQRVQPQPHQPGHGTHSKARDLRTRPAIAPQYLSTAEDRKVAADSLRVTRRIVAQTALAPYQPEEWKPGLSTRAMKTWRAWRATLPPPSSTP